MGFRLCGIAIDKNFSNSINPLLESLMVEKVADLGQSAFDEKTLDILSDDELAFISFDDGTLLLTGIEIMTNDAVLTQSSAGISIIAFYIDGITSTFCFDFYTDGDYVRRKWISQTDSGIDSSDNFGNPLEIENSENDDQEIIFKIIGSLLGHDFFEIDEDELLTVIEIRKKIIQKGVEKKGLWKRLFG